MADHVLKSFSGSLPYGLEESRELRALISWVFGVIGIKNAKNFSEQFLFEFMSCHFGYTSYFEVQIFIFSNIMPRGVSICTTFLELVLSEM